MKSIIFLVCLLSIFGIFHTASAITTPLVTDIAIRNLNILEKSDKDIKISFDLINKGIPLSNVVYSVELKKDSLVADFKSLGDVMSFKTGETKTLSTTYTFPFIPKGVYELSIKIYSLSGSLLASRRVVNLEMEGQNVFGVTPESCVLKTSKSSKKYSLAETVVLFPSEQLTLSCDITNTRTDSVTLTPVLKTFDGNRLGSQVSQSVLVDKIIIIPSDSKKTVTIDIPLPIKSETYATALYFADGKGHVSNTVTARYVLRNDGITVKPSLFSKIIRLYLYVPPYILKIVTGISTLFVIGLSLFMKRRKGLLLTLLIVVGVMGGVQRAEAVSVEWVDAARVRTETLDLTKDTYTSDEPVILDANFTPYYSIQASTYYYHGDYIFNSIERELYFQYVIKNNQGNTVFESTPTRTPGEQVIYDPVISGQLPPGDYSVRMRFGTPGHSLFYSYRSVSCYSSDYVLSTSFYSGDPAVFIENASGLPITVLSYSGIDVNTPFYEYAGLPFGEYTAALTVGQQETESCSGNDDNTSAFGDWTASYYIGDGFSIIPITYTSFTIANSDTPPTGALETASCSAITGYAVDSDTSNSSLTVELYKNAPKESGGVFVGTYTTNVPRPDINQSLGITGTHGYSIIPPNSLRTDSNVSLYTYALGKDGSDINNGNDTLLTGSPRTINCTPILTTCTDPIATNYNQVGLCEYPPETVCTDVNANNYGYPEQCAYSLCTDPTANNQGSALPCTYPPESLCTNPLATNYNSPLPCTYPPNTCINPLATNIGEPLPCTFTPTGPEFTLGGNQTMNIKVLSTGTVESEEKQVFIYPNGEFLSAAHPVTVNITQYPPALASTTFMYSFDGGNTYSSSPSLTISHPYSSGIGFKVRVVRLAGAPDLNGPYTIKLTGTSLNSSITGTTDIVLNPTRFDPKYQEI